jgi:quercetin dioxygenase-like cupin family protein
MILGAAAIACAAQAQPSQPPLAAAGSGGEGATNVVRRASGAPTPGPAANFTGQVTVRGSFRLPGSSRASGATVSFAPGARSAWHSHPLGQTLVVTEGCGWTQVRGGKVEEICAGDVAWVGPGQVHWHGATPTSAMTHVAISETAEGQSVQWLQKVTAAEYRRTQDPRP